MWAVITELARSGVTVFLTTQYLEEADQLADRIALVDGGRVVAEGTSAQLKQRFVRAPPGPDARRRGRRSTRWSRYLGDRAALPDRDRAHACPSPPTAARRTSARCSTSSTRTARAVDRFAVHTATLDDVFLALTGHATHRAEKETAGV